MREIGKDSRDFPIAGHAPQTDIIRVCERHQHRHAVAPESQQVEFLESGTERAGADVLDGSNALVGIDHLVANAKRHTGTPTGHAFRVSTAFLLYRSQIVRLANNPVKGEIVENRH